MKHILIAGKNSYIGESFRKFACENFYEYTVSDLDMKERDWEKTPFSSYDAMLYVAGIVHNLRAPESLHYEVNRDLVERAAIKAKKEGVKQFIFMSTMSVYGKESRLGCKNEITEETPFRPGTAYGKSKLEAENRIGKLADEAFIVTILRPPMVYGPGCYGNYVKLREITLKYGLIPAFENERSMIYIKNLCAGIHVLIQERKGGKFCLKDGEQFNTAAVMEKIAIANKKTYKKSKILGKIIIVTGKFLSPLQKAFGNLTYDEKLCGIEGATYRRYTLEKAIEETEEQWKK